MSTGRLAIAPSPATVGSWRIIPSGGPTHSVGPTPLWTGPGRPESFRRSERLGPGTTGKAALEGWSVAASSLFWSPW